MTAYPFTYHQDPGHGWLQVPVETLTTFGKTEADFSPYSYHDCGHVYLEEDGDMPAFLNLWRDRFGVFPDLREAHTDDDHWIRGLDRCSGANWVSPFKQKELER
jgi:hypothetical protein